MYLASCSQGPLSTRVQGAVTSFIQWWDEHGLGWEEWGRQVESARSGFAALINASPEDIAIGTSMSQIVSSVVSAYVRERRAPRRRIVSSLGEFPGVAHGWLGARAYGWRVDQLAADAAAPLDPLDVIAAVDEDTAIVCVPHVSYQSGGLLELSEVIAAAHARGAVVFVDAYQSLGTIPIDVRENGTDFLASGAAKYLCGTPGFTFLYVRPGLREQLEPTVTGWFGRSGSLRVRRRHARLRADGRAVRSRFALGPSRCDRRDRHRRHPGGWPRIASARMSRTWSPPPSTLGASSGCACSDPRWRAHAVRWPRSTQARSRRACAWPRPFANATSSRRPGDEPSA